MTVSAAELAFYKHPILERTIAVSVEGRRVAVISPPQYGCTKWVIHPINGVDTRGNLLQCMGKQFKTLWKAKFDIEFAVAEDYK
jgi:hypothetical protein